MPPAPTREEYVRGPDGEVVERHLYRNQKGGTVRADTVVLLDDEDRSDVFSVQTAFDNSEGLIIEGGFFGINARSAAVKYSEMQLQRQLEQDRAHYALQREKLAMERERQQAELEIERLKAQNAAWSQGGQAQYTPPNLYPGFTRNPEFYDQRMNGHQLGTGYGRAGPYQSAPGPLLHSQSESLALPFPEPHPAPAPYLSRTQTDSQIRPATQFTEPESMEEDPTPHRDLEEMLPAAPRHTPQRHTC